MKIYRNKSNYESMRILNYKKFKLNEELEFKMIPTTYQEVNIKSLFISGQIDKIFRFNSKSDTSYDLYFSFTKETNHTLSDDTNLHDYTKYLILTIFFSLTERGLDPLVFDNLTNKSEQFEVMGKIIWLINEHHKKYKYDVYSIGEVDEKKYKFYTYFLHNLPQFSILKGNSDNYNGRKCYYLINKIPSI